MNDPYAAPEVSNWFNATPKMATVNKKPAIAVMVGNKAICYIDPKTVCDLIRFHGVQR